MGQDSTDDQDLPAEAIAIVWPTAKQWDGRNHVHESDEQHPSRSASGC